LTQTESNERVVVVYARVSTEKQDIERQRVQHDRAVHDNPGREIVKIDDDGVSAFKIPIFDRPGGRQLCEMIASGRVEAIYTDAQDRLSRGKQFEWWQFVELVLDAGTRLFIDGRELRLGEEGDEIKSAIDAIIARRESSTRSHRVSTGRRKAVAAGRRNGGPRPFGYEHVKDVVNGTVTSRVVVYEAERDALVGMFLDYVAGKSMTQIARELNQAGVRTVRGAKWSQTRVAQMLRNPLYKGKVRYKDELFDGQHEALVSSELWDQVERMRKAAFRGEHKGGRPPIGRHLLTGGILRCSCGAAMSTRTERKGYGNWEAYLCTGRNTGRTNCTMPALSRELIDTAVWSYFEKVGIDYEAMMSEHETWRALELDRLARQIAEQVSELERAETELARIKADYRAGDLSAKDWSDFRDEITSEHEGAAAALAQLRQYESEIREAALATDAQDEALQQLQLIREALAGLREGTTDLKEARRALGRVFESFGLRRWEDALPDVVNADLAAADWFLVPTVKADAILTPLVMGTGADGGPEIEQDEVLRRVAVGMEKPRASSR
jgi:site-specific DNA recombinase